MLGTLGARVLILCDPTGTRSAPTRHFERFGVSVGHRLLDHGFVYTSNEQPADAVRVVVSEHVHVGGVSVDGRVVGDALDCIVCIVEVGGGNPIRAQFICLKVLRTDDDADVAIGARTKVEKIAKLVSERRFEIVRIFGDAQGHAHLLAQHVRFDFLSLWQRIVGNFCGIELGLQVRARVRFHLFELALGELDISLGSALLGPSLAHVLNVRLFGGGFLFDCATSFLVRFRRAGAIKVLVPGNARVGARAG